MRAGRSRSRKRQTSTLARISQLYDPLQGGDGMRRMPFYPLLITILVSIGGYLGCDPRQVEQNVENQIGQQFGRAVEQFQPAGGMPGGAIPSGAIPSGAIPGGAIPGGGLAGIPGVPVSTANNSQLANTPLMPMPPRSANTLVIGSFNMQRFGPSKMSDATVMQYFADIIRRFDVIALQEITTRDANAVPQLLQYVNAGGQRYGYTISPQIGRNYFEQYAFVFDTTRVATRQDACFVMRDEEDLLHREPFVGRFSTLSANPFTFALINMHTDPDLVDEELNTLASVYINVSNFFYQGDFPEDDVILLGDLNADPRRFRGLGQVPNLVPTIVGIPTNFTRSKTNDNILINRLATREFTGRAGALDLQTLYKLQEGQAKLISDHQPVWAEFTISEVAPSQVARGPAVSWSQY